jgi:hypothetical protein
MDAQAATAGPCKNAGILAQKVDGRDINLIFRY